MKFQRDISYVMFVIFIVDSFANLGLLDCLFFPEGSQSDI